MLNVASLPGDGIGALRSVPLLLRHAAGEHGLADQLDAVLSVGLR